MIYPSLENIATGGAPFVPDFIPNTFRKVDEVEGTAIEMFGLKYKLEDLKALEGKNAFVNFQDGSYAIGLVRNVTNDFFDIGQTQGNQFHFVTNFREV